MSHLYSVGALVDVAPVSRRGRPNSEGGRAYVKRSSSPTSVVSSYDVQYVVTRKISKEVPPDRLSPAKIDTVARRRSDVPIQPSLLSPHLQASKRILSTVTPSPPKRAKSTSILVTLVTTAVLLDRGRQFKDNNTSHHPILVYLQRNNHKDAGYLRRNDAKVAGIELKPQLSVAEKHNVLRIKAQLTGVVDFKVHGVTQLIANAFGVSKRAIQGWEKKAATDLQRKSRSDAGTNLLTSSKLQENYHGAYQVFKKAYRRQKISDTLLGDNSNIDDDRLFDLWNGIMSDEDRKPYVDMSNRFKERAPFLPGEITSILKNTNGSVTWRQIETALSENGVPIVSEGTIRTIFMGLPGSEYTSTKLLPALTTAHIIKRKLWCQQFWIFWDSARKFIRKRILLVHMDEKWFFTVVVRLNNKLVPFLGMEKSDSCRSVHHKNYLKKLLCIGTTAYLCNKNNIAAGGRGFHCKIMSIQSIATGIPRR